MVDTKTPSTNSISLKNLQPGTEYSWIVRGINDGGEGEWSYEWYFTTKHIPPTAQVTLLEPADGAVNLPKNIDFKWSVIPGATEYQIQVFNESDSIVKEYDNITTEDDITVLKTVRNLLLGTNYKWQVRGKNSAGVAPWSEQWTFSTAPAPPGMVLLLEPVHLATEITTLPLLKWFLTDNANSYHFQLLEYDTEVLVVEDTSLTFVGGDTIVFQIQVELKGLTKYKWHVAAINDGGKGPWSEFRIFTTWDPTSIYDNDYSEFDCKIFPNPANENGILELNLRSEESFKISIFNVLGQIIFDLDYNNYPQGYNKIPLDLSNFEDGFYYVMIRGTNHQVMKKLIIQND